jgi:hypothetical protein
LFVQLPNLKQQKIYFLQGLAKIKMLLVYSIDSTSASGSTIDNNEKSQSQDCQTDHPKESNPIQTENLEIKQYRRINRRVKSDAALEMAENRKRKLNRSNSIEHSLVNDLFLSMLRV